MFHSTRGTKLKKGMDAIIEGIAEDGGLYVIDKIPTVDIKEFIGLDYYGMAKKVLHLFFDDFTYEEISNLVDEAYHTFQIEEVVRLKETKDCYFLELFHGPTMAFKDIALVVLPRLIALSKKKKGIKEKTTILTATSGDTGGAALSGFSGIEGIDVYVMYPNNGVSPIQERQMLNFVSDNAHVIALEGNFDDCQTFVKEFFLENKDLNLSSANSINIGRLVPQIVYYFYSYIYLVNQGKIKLGDKINFTVPTGNFGNIFAGFYAIKMGLPINKLICASNKNKVLTDYFKTGTYNRLREFYKTNSPSMDILISSNLERMLYYACGENELRVKELMDALKNDGSYEFSNPFDIFYASFATEDDTYAMINKMYKENNYVLDPHTAVAYKACLDYKNESNDGLMNVVVSTASPFKFPQAVLKGLEIENNLQELDQVKLLSKSCNLEIPSVLNFKENEKNIWKKEGAKEALREAILNA